MNLKSFVGLSLRRRFRRNLDRKRCLICFVVLDYVCLFFDGLKIPSSVGLTLSSSMFFSQSVLAITMKGHNVVVIQRAIPDLVVIQRAATKREICTPWREEERRIYSVSGLLKLHKRRCSYIG
ncbi:hypothetical protein DY000_02034935 [Brassica cretica]|uniref:Uncharacterized protein n=1 Tax=Brassica cretica TaxID=69181 RepID=A0ABQ7DM55_BRACR|nr:hypothetical protein DY000_02034935 [Brassica cretica]